MLCKCHPWQLDSGDPCRNDGSWTCGNINSSYDPLTFLIMCSAHCKSNRAKNV